MRPRRNVVSAPTALLVVCAALCLFSPASRAEPVALTARPAATADAGALGSMQDTDAMGGAADTAVTDGAGAVGDMAAPVEAAIETSAPPETATAAADAAAPVREVVSDLLQHQAERSRRAQLAQAYLQRPPTWIQDAATVNLGDFPTLHDPSADTERTVQTLEWVLREQARQAAGRRANASEADATPPTGWRRLLPGHWLPVLKQNRDLVLSAGAGLLVLGWALSAVPRRSGGAARRKALRTVPAAPEDAKPRRRRRRRIHLHDDAGHQHGHHGQRSHHGHHRHVELAPSPGRH